MSEDYETQQGDCICSIAYDHGFFWETLWNHPQNAGLKKLRNDANALLPGDLVHIPDLQQKKVPGATEQQHKFRLKGVPARFMLRLLDQDSPRAGLSYKLVIDGKCYAGQTDADGNISEFISPSARQGKLMLGEEGEEYELDLGHLDPIDEVTGIQARLANLGFYADEITGEDDDATQEALKSFQRAYKLSETGEPDAATKAKLSDVYGC